MVDTTDLKSVDSDVVGVQVPPLPIVNLNLASVFNTRFS